MISKRLVSFASVYLLVFIVGWFALPPDLAVDVYQRIAYPVVLGSWILLGVTLVSCKWFSVQDSLRGIRNLGIWLPLVFVLSASIFAFHHQLEFKTLGDEGLVTSVSQNIHYNRSIDYIWRAYSVDGSFSVIESFPEKRPIAFSVLASLIHDLTGYRVENGFYLNLALGLIMILLLGWLGYRFAGKLGATLGMIAVPSLPIISFYAHGAGIDVLNMLMILVAFSTALLWVEHQDNASFYAFLSSVAVLVFSRYESIIFLVPFGLIVAWNIWRRREWVMPYPTFAFILTAVLLPLQQAVFRHNAGFWELDSKPEATSVFGLQYLPGNYASAINFLFDGSHTYPNSPVVSILGVIAIIILFTVFLLTIAKRKEIADAYWVTFLFSIGPVLHMVLILVYFYGQIDSIILHRFSLPIYLLMIISSMVLLGLLNRAWLKGLWVALFAVGLVYYSIPCSADHVYEDRYVPSSHSRWVREYVKEHPPANYLVVDFNPLLWTTLNVSSINYSRANQVKDRIQYQLSEGSIKDIFVIENHVVSSATGEFRITSDAPLDEDFLLEEISSEVLSPSHVIKWKRILGFKEDVVKDGKDEIRSKPDVEGNRETQYYLNLP